MVRLRNATALQHGGVLSAAFSLRGISGKRIRGKADTWEDWTLTFIHWWRQAVTLPFPWYLDSDVTIASSVQPHKVSKVN